MKQITPFIALTVIALSGTRTLSDEPNAVRQRKTKTQTAKPKAPPSRFPALNNRQAWQALPEAQLPAWATTLAKTLPATTAAMLQLDYTHRAECPLDPLLRAKLRWAAADANQCDYSKRYAEADLRRLGMGDKKLNQFVANQDHLPAAERVALTFARKLTLKAYKITDDEFAEVVNHHGAENVVAMVHVVAHANFQDRIFLALGLTVEPGGPLSPLALRFGKNAKQKVPIRKQLKTTKAINAGADLPKGNQSFTALQKSLEHQRKRKARLPMADWKKAMAKLPPGQRNRPPSRVKWTRLSAGYQPKLTKAWFDCMGQFGREAKMDRVFSNTMFWVITQSNECFY